MKNVPHARFLALPAIAGALFALICDAQPPPPGEEGTPKPVPAGEVVEYTKMLPILPEPPEGWKADPAEGSTDDLGDAQISTVHRDYSKGDGPDAATTSISILDSVASPDYVELTTAGWTRDETTPEGYTKAITIEGMPGFETFDNDEKHGTLWLLVAKRYFLQIETTAQEPAALHEWLKRMDLKKLAELK